MEEREYFDWKTLLHWDWGLLEIKELKEQLLSLEKYKNFKKFSATKTKTPNFIPRFVALLDM